MICNKQWYTAITSSFKFILSIKGEKKTLAKYILYDLRVLIRKNQIICVSLGCLANCKYNIICLIEVNIFAKSSGSSLYR